MLSLTGLAFTNDNKFGRADNDMNDTGIRHATTQHFCTIFQIEEQQRIGFRFELGDLPSIRVGWVGTNIIRIPLVFKQ